VNVTALLPLISKFANRTLADLDAATVGQVLSALGLPTPTEGMISNILSFAKAGDQEGGLVQWASDNAETLKSLVAAAAPTTVHIHVRCPHCGQGFYSKLGR